MTQIPENSEFLTLVQKLYPQFSKSLILDYRILTTCPYIPLPTTWEEYFGSFSSKTQKTLRRMLKSLGKEHEVEFEKFSGDGLERHVRETFELKQKRWQKLHLSGGIASDQKAMAFYIDVAKSFSEKGWLHLSFLKVDGDAVSAVYGFTYNQKFYWCIPGFDPDYSKYGVGTLLTMYLIEDAIKMGLKEFDFLVGEESHKLRWHTLSRSNIQVVLLKRSLLNKLQLKLLYAIFRLDVICKRSLLENYRLYLIMRKEKRRRRERKRRHISEI
jgi:CelD/BcsL family acetyltransferase involved in cellulose biosynthesis